MPRTEKQQQLYEERKAKGLCTRCGMPANGKLQCPKHLEMDVARHNVYYAKHPEKANAWRRENPAEAKTRAHEQYLKHPERVAARTRRWRAAHPERTRELNRLAYARNPEAKSARNKAYTAAHPEMMKRALRRSYLRRKHGVRVDVGNYYLCHCGSTVEKNPESRSLCGSCVAGTAECGETGCTGRLPRTLREAKTAIGWHHLPELAKIMDPEE